MPENNLIYSLLILRIHSCPSVYIVKYNIFTILVYFIIYF